MIYATVGTMHLPFVRLIRSLDAIALKSDEEVVVQTGLDTALPENCTHFAFKSRDEVLAIQSEARVVVCHGGIGSVTDVLQLGRPLIVVPRRARYGEHNNDHQMDLAQAVEKRGWGRLILDIEDLAEACAKPPQPYADYAPAKAPLLEALRRAAESSLKHG